MRWITVEEVENEVEVCQSTIWAIPSRGDEFDHRLIVLVAIERYATMKNEVVVPNKGSTGRSAVKMVLELIDEARD